MYRPPCGCRWVDGVCCDDALMVRRKLERAFVAAVTTGEWGEFDTLRGAWEAHREEQLRHDADHDDR